MQSDAMYAVLETKFNDLVTQQENLARRNKKNDVERTPETNRKSFLETMAHVTSSVQCVVPDAAHLALMQKEQSEEDSLSHELQLVMNDISDMNLGEFDQSYTTELIKKVFNVDKFDRHEQVAKAKPAEAPSSHPTHEVFECHLCGICFESRGVLDIHIEHSELHRRSLKERERRLEEAHKEAMRLTSMARNVMNTLYMGLPVKEETEEKKEYPAGSYEAILEAINKREQHHEDLRRKWKRGLDKVLHRRMTEKFAAHLKTRIDVPRGVELLYEGCKYFHRNKTTYDLRYLVHTSSDILEVVPHYVPYCHDKSVLEESPLNPFVASKRIFLRYSEVVKAFFGYNITHTQLTDGVHIVDAPLMLNLKGSFHRAEIAALDIFITNRIKIHKSHGRDDALFFDLHGVSHDCLVKVLPKRFQQVPVAVDVIANIWRQKTQSSATTTTTCCTAAAAAGADVLTQENSEASPTCSVCEVDASAKTVTVV